MEVQTTQMDPRVAKIYLKDYRDKVAEHQRTRKAAAEKQIKDGGKMFRAGRQQRSLLEKEDEILLESYRAMAKGQKLLNLTTVIGRAGLDEKTKMPLLAAAGADWEHAWLHIPQWGPNHVVFAKDRYINGWSARTGRYVGSSSIVLPSTVFSNELMNSNWRRANNMPSTDSQKALVPSIPAHLRPAGDLSKYTILWEATWTKDAPVDPLLLQHVAGTMYAVLAQWDLTPLERQILEGRIT